MIVPTSFAFHVTYTCPLTCASCCFSSGPTNGDKLDFELLVATIRAIDTSKIKMVAFTGGEPFLLGGQLDLLVNEAHKKGLVTRIVTSAYWAKYPVVAGKRLEKLTNSGLDELSISWDDFHEAQTSFALTFDNVSNAFWAAKRLGVRVAVNIVQASNSIWNAEKVRKELGLPADSTDVVVESPLNLTGRAEKELEDAGLRAERFLGPCPYVLTGPTLSAKKKLLACCGVIQPTEQLVLDDDFDPENLASAIRKGMQSPLLNWLFLRGPFSILEWIASKDGLELPSKDRIGGNCEACRHLFHSPEYASRVCDAANDKAEEIGGEMAVLTALGYLANQANASVLDLWNDQGQTVVSRQHEIRGTEDQGQRVGMPSSNVTYTQITRTA